MTQYHLEDVSAFRAKGEADPDLVGALADYVRNHSVNSEPGEQQGGQREERDDFHQESPLGERRGNRFVESLRTRDGKRWIERLHLLAHCISDRSGAQMSAQKDRKTLGPSLV